MASELSSSNEYRNNSPCWSALDDILRQRLSVLHHSLGSSIVDPATAADDFSHVVGELLLEQGIISVTPRPSSSGPHRPRPIETTLNNLSRMKNTARKCIKTHCDNFLNLVRAHHAVKKCHSKQQRVNLVQKHETEFRKNPWQYAG